MNTKRINQMEKAKAERKAQEDKEQSSKNSDFDSNKSLANVPSASFNAGAVDTVFFDGHCGLCHRTVRFLLASDKNGTRFRFAPLDSAAFRTSFSERERSEFPESLIVHTDAGEVLTRSTASLYLLRRLGGLWRLLGGLLALIPLGLRDAVYEKVARMRYYLFATPTDACPLIPPELRSRFLE